MLAISSLQTFINMLIKEVINFHKEKHVSDILDEIKEDLQNEKYAKLWDEYSTYVLATIVVIVLCTAGYAGWNAYAANKYTQSGSQLYSAYMQEKENNSEESLAAFSAVEKNGSSGQAGIAALRKADTLVSGGKVDEAIKIYKEVAATSSYPQEIRDLADLLYVQDSLSSDNNPELLNKLQGLANANGVFKYSAKEILAFYNLNSGKAEDAKKLFEELSADNSSPIGIKERADEMLSSLSGKV
jgi:hypothetical protein